MIHCLLADQKKPGVGSAPGSMKGRTDPAYCAVPMPDIT